jgi:hypothetical protein
MSQGIILRDGQPKRSDLDVQKGTYICSCGEKFIIYHHAAHPEGSVGEQTAWLTLVLEEDHKRNANHGASYHFPR